jgi:hypothetical protein
MGVGWVNPIDATLSCKRGSSANELKLIKLLCGEKYAEVNNRWEHVGRQASRAFFKQRTYAHLVNVRGEQGNKKMPPELQAQAALFNRIYLSLTVRYYSTS